MLRQVQKNKNNISATHLLLFALALTLFGCSYNTIMPGMTAADLEMKQAGYHLECTDYRDEKCVVMEWFNGNDTDGTNSSNN